jgi:hypothetical protein
MKNQSVEKFAELVIEESRRAVAESERMRPASFRSTSTKVSPSKKSLGSELGIMVIGVLALLAACILLFDGVMVPAMWQLTSVTWIMWRLFKA